MGLDELLFYGGLIMAAVFLLLGMITAFLLKVRQIRLNAKLDEEYGKAAKDRR